MSPSVTPFQEKVRGTLTQQIASLGHAATNNDLAITLNCTVEEIEKALQALHDTHSLLLQPHKTEPWVVHPFALYPASCWVQIHSDDGRSAKGHWATCLYCAFGIAAALKSDADIFTRFGGESEQCIVRVRGGDIAEKNLVFHLSTPIRHWWDNVIHSCASFQPFRCEEDVDDWCRRHAWTRGAVVPMEQMWRFASAWYGGYVEEPWRKRSGEEVKRVLEDNGLKGPFWSVE